MTRVLVNFIQDRSGSMNSVWAETLSGFKAFVNDLKSKGSADGVEYLFTLTTFDTLIGTPLKAVPIGNVDVDELKKHEPRGCTALYDAVGKTIEATDKGVDKVICVIVTDGQENSSREWSKDAVHSAIDAKITLGNWTFTYLGTQPETWNDAVSIGVGVGATFTYDANKAQAAYHVTANAIHNLSRSTELRSTCLASSHFTDASAAADAGMKTWTTPVAKTTPIVQKTTKVVGKSWRRTPIS